MSRPDGFTPRKRGLMPNVQDVAWALGPVWTGAEKLALAGIDPRTVQLRALHRKNAYMNAPQC